MTDKDREDVYDDLIDDPVDDLKSDESYGDDLSDTAWDESDDSDESGTKEPATAKKKKGSSFNLIVISLGVLLFLGFAYFKFAAPPPPAAPRDMAAVPATDGAIPEEMAATSPPPAPAMELGDLPQPSEMPSVPANAPPMAENPSGAVDLAPAPDFTMVPDMPPPVSDVPAETSVASAVIPSEPAPVVDIPQIEVPPTPAATSSDPVPPMLPAQNDQATSPAPSVPQASGFAPDAETTARLEAVTKELAEVKEKVQAAPAQDLTPVLTQLDAIATRLARLEDRVQQEAARPPVPTQESEPVRAASKPLAESSPSLASAQTTSESAVSRAPRYRLQAVSGGKAYLAPARGGELLTVQAGDLVDGLGRIQSIEQRVGRWVVIGTKGRVSQ